MKVFFIVVGVLSVAGLTDGMGAVHDNQLKYDLVNTEKMLAVEHMRFALVCHKSGEQRQGQTKVCMYNCAGSIATVTVGWNELCPVTINK